MLSLLIDALLKLLKTFNNDSLKKGIVLKKQPSFWAISDSSLSKNILTPFPSSIIEI